MTLVFLRALSSAHLLHHYFCHSTIYLLKRLLVSWLISYWLCCLESFLRFTSVDFNGNCVIHACLVFAFISIYLCAYIYLYIIGLYRTMSHCFHVSHFRRSQCSFSPRRLAHASAGKCVCVRIYNNICQPAHKCAIHSCIFYASPFLSHSLPFPRLHVLYYIIFKLGKSLFIHWRQNVYWIYSVSYTENRFSRRYTFFFFTSACFDSVAHIVCGAALHSYYMYTYIL